ncbi:hypothetical protein FRX31_024337 [Thalictrum thalictroides]|uniref:Uncharacterized protein n=1 Tax=Thalictrum thalictroides TaxID=46969 RepID=A0A7J6VLS6_THATH|nr:hypothetical protein FRX31_024337 [Thalictrum thalictroides]
MRLTRIPRAENNKNPLLRYPQFLKSFNIALHGQGNLACTSTAPALTENKLDYLFQRCIQQVNEYTEKLKSSELELQSLVDTIMVEADDVEVAGSVYIYGKA